MQQRYMWIRQQTEQINTDQPKALAAGGGLLHVYKHVPASGLDGSP